MIKSKFVWEFFFGVIAWIPLLTLWVLYMIAKFEIMSYDTAMRRIFSGMGY